MVTAYQGTVQNGQIHFDDIPDFPEGAQVIVVVVGEGQQQKALTMGDLLESPLIGMWADRDDIVDSAEFARQLRERAAKRGE
jgi:hypothetical protein